MLLKSYTCLYSFVAEKGNTTTNILIHEETNIIEDFAETITELAGQRASTAGSHAIKTKQISAMADN